MSKPKDLSKDQTKPMAVGRRVRKLLGRTDSGYGVSLREAYDSGRLGKLTFEEAAEAVLSGRVSVEGLVDVNTDPDGFSDREREAKRTLDKSLHAEWDQPHRNYVPDERPWKLAMTPTPWSVAYVSPDAAKNEACVELLKGHGYDVYVEDSATDCGIPALTYEDRNWPEALEAYKARVPRGSQPWHGPVARDKQPEKKNEETE